MFEEATAGSGSDVVPAVAPKTESGLPPIDKIVIAIHGIGSQQRSATIRSVALRFGELEKTPLPVMPLGYFNIGKTGEVHMSRLEAPKGSTLEGIGFAEVFWADIPRQVVKEGDTLEETKAWGASVVSRAQAAYVRRVSSDEPLLESADFRLCADVIEEIVETVAVMEKLLAVTEKMGLFKFDLAPILRDHIGDVQLVAEFGYYRQLILARFHGTMAQIVSECKGKAPEIYLIAHSEGSVVSFLGLLQALSGHIVRDPEKSDAIIPSDWIKQVRGFMTFGSPIDKHLVLWEKMWDGLDLRSTRKAGAVVFGKDGQERLRLPHPIQWRNYYDYGDPIGFRLETTDEFLATRKCVAFEFDRSEHNIGFSRYLFPGKAHTDYWGDEKVFRHFIDDVVMRKPGQAKLPGSARPQSKWYVETVSTALPYLLSLLLHLAAVFLLFKTVTVFMTEGRPAANGAAAVDAVSGLKAFSGQVLLLGWLLFGVTVAGRLPRLVKTKNRWRWHVLALFAFLLGAVPSWYLLPKEVADFLAKYFVGFVAVFGVFAEKEGVAGVLTAAALVALTGWVVRRRGRFARHLLMAAGALVVSVMVVGRMYETAAEIPRTPSVWPVALAGLAFFYLWWLGILLFDLAFIWHRYIRWSVVVRTLSEWHRGKEARPEALFKKPERTRR